MSDEFFQQIDRLILSSTNDVTLDTPSKILRDAGAPTSSIAVLDHGNITSHCISTCGDDTETLFQACSISKPTAGVAAMRLVDLGYFSTTDKIKRLLPNELVELFNDDRTKAAFEAVTVAQLMSHTSGLSVPSFPGYQNAEDIPTVKQFLQGTEHSRTMPIRFHTLPGAEFMYSGGGIELLRAVMEHTTNTPFPEIMQKHVFDPLGMTRSRYITNIARETNVSRCYYNGYRECESRWHYQPELAGAGLWTTPTDLLKLVRGVQNSLRGDGILGQATAEMMLTRVTKNIALTWFTNALAFVHAGGNEPGWRCMLVGYAELPRNGKAQDIPSECGFAVMTNSASALPALWKLLHAIPFLKGWPDVPIMIGTGDFKAPFRADVEVDDRWKEWIGSWTDRWQIRQGEHGEAIAGVEDGVLLRLRTAALPAKKCDGGRTSIDLIVDGTELMLRLGFEDETRVVELCNGATGGSRILHSLG